MIIYNDVILHLRSFIWRFKDYYYVILIFDLDNEK